MWSCTVFGYTRSFTIISDMKPNQNYILGNVSYKADKNAKIAADHLIISISFFGHIIYKQSHVTTVSFSAVQHLLAKRNGTWSWCYRFDVTSLNHFTVEFTQSVSQPESKNSPLKCDCTSDSDAVIYGSELLGF